MSGLLSYSGLTTKIRAMQSHLLNDQNFREIVELESVPQAVSYLKQHKSYEDLFEGYNEADLHRGQIEKMLRLTVYRDFPSCTVLQMWSRESSLRSTLNDTKCPLSKNA